MTAHGLKLFALEKASSRVVLAKHFDVRHALQSFAFDGERKHSLEGGELTVDRGRRRAAVETLRAVPRHVGARDLHRAQWAR